MAGTMEGNRSRLTAAIPTIWRKVTVLGMFSMSQCHLGTELERRGSVDGFVDLRVGTEEKMFPK
jgi:hypothetical protein